MDGVEDLTEKLNSTWQEISTKLYENSQESTETQKPDEEVTDVEYEEVK